MAGMFDNSIVIEVQQANDIVDLISEHVSLKKKGREMVGGEDSRIQGVEGRVLAGARDW